MTPPRHAFAPWETGDPMIVLLCDALSPEAAHGLAVLWETAGLAFGGRRMSTDSLADLPPDAVVLRYLPPQDLKRMPRPGAACLDIPLAGGDGEWEPRVHGLPSGETVTLPAAAFVGGDTGDAWPFDLFLAVHQLSTARWEIDAARRAERIDSWSVRTTPPPLDVPAVDLLALWFKDRLAETFASAGRPFLTVDRAPPGFTMSFLVALDFDTYGKDLLERAKQAHGVRRRVVNQLKAPGRNWRAALRTGWREGLNLFKPGPYDRIPRVARWLEDQGLRGSFNIYVPYRSKAETGWLWRLRQKIYDPNYDILKMPRYTAHFRDMMARGHEIGLQYGAFSSEGHPEDIALQAEILDGAVGRRPRTGRHHFLKLNLATFADLLERAGLGMDTSPAYLDASGFRLAAAGPVRGYNHGQRRSSEVIFVPTPLWDGVLTNGNSHDPTETIETIVGATARVGGAMAAGIHPRSFGSTDFYGPHWPTFEATLGAARRAGAWCVTAEAFFDWWTERAGIRASRDGGDLILPAPRGPMSFTLRQGDAIWTLALHPDRPPRLDGPAGVAIRRAEPEYRLSGIR
ncbi:MAG: hypothetical protein H7841_05475 [Magnetospirillum sp. WYHS-4]